LEFISLSHIKIYNMKSTKLSLEKFTICKLQNLNSIKGGNTGEPPVSLPHNDDDTKWPTTVAPPADPMCDDDSLVPDENNGNGTLLNTLVTG